VMIAIRYRIEVLADGTVPAFAQDVSIVTSREPEPIP